MTSIGGTIVGTTISALRILILCSSVAFYVCLGLKDAPVGKDAIEETTLDSGQFIIRKRMTQAEAREYCETRGAGGGRLVVLLTAEDATALINAVKSVSTPYTNDTNEKASEFGMSRRYWIGLTDVAKEGEWVWMNDGTVLQYDSLWYPGQPDHGKKTEKNETVEHCVVLWNPIFFEKETHTFNDEPCMTKHYPICEDKK